MDLSEINVRAFPCFLKHMHSHFAITSFFITEHFKRPLLKTLVMSAYSVNCKEAKQMD